jgi:hypothetical protein
MQLGGTPSATPGPHAEYSTVSTAGTAEPGSRCPIRRGGFQSSEHTVSATIRMAEETAEVMTSRPQLPTHNSL